jgi:hypothetical protein
VVGNRKPETGRVCAVCGKTHAPSGRKDTYGFRTILSRSGIKGDKAHPECVQALAKRRPRMFDLWKGKEHNENE